MKKQGFILVVLLAVLVGCCRKTEQAQSAYSAINWTDSTTAKYRYDKNVNQLILVQYTGGSEAIVRLFVKSYQDTMPVWTEKLMCDGLVGQKGISANRREGSMKTPIGDFGMITAFGIKPNPGTQLPYIDIDENIYGCDDEWYNQIIDIREHPHQCTGEHMIDYSPHYNYGFFFDFNKEQVRGLGCSIFFHCMGPNPYTGSCIAVSEENMVTILQNIDMSARIIINYL
mgnify:CR=1 FL=1